MIFIVQSGKKRFQKPFVENQILKLVAVAWVKMT